MLVYLNVRHVFIGEITFYSDCGGGSFCFILRADVPGENFFAFGCDDAFS